MFIGPCIIAIVDEWKTNLMSLAILFHLLCAQHVSDINISFCRLKQAEACFSLQNEHHQIPAATKARTENKTTDVVIHQHSRKLLKMDILMSETCWAHSKWNKIASDIKLVFHSSTSCSFWIESIRESGAWILTDYLQDIARHLSSKLLNYTNVQAGRPKKLGSNPSRRGSPFLSIS